MQEHQQELQRIRKNAELETERLKQEVDLKMETKEVGGTWCVIPFGKV